MDSKRINIGKKMQFKFYKTFLPALCLTCKGYESWEPEYGKEYDCAYEMAGDIFCDQCVCCNGQWNPETGKKISWLEKFFVRRRARKYWRQRRRKDRDL